MNASDAPRSITLPWASQAGGSYVRQVPMAGSSGDTGASYAQGFPPATFTPQGSGGSPVDGRDENGVLGDLSAWARWFKAGGVPTYDSAFSTAVGGYPAGAILQSATMPGLLYRSTADGNTNNPDTNIANWLIITGATGKNSNGRWVKGPGEYISQKGFVSGSFGEGTQSFTFPIVFPNACEGLIATAVNASGGNNRDIWAEAQSWSTSGASVFLNYVAASGVPQCDGFTWEAWGY